MSSSDARVTYEIVQSKQIDLENYRDRRHALPADFDKLDENEQWSGSFYFIQAADTQFGLIDRYLKKLAAFKWDEEIRLSELLVEKCNRMTPKPMFMVICGDLVDAQPGSAYQDKRQDQIYDFKRIFSRLDKSIPLVCVCGNHDIGEEPTRDALLAYKKEFGDDYFYFVKRGVLFIVINSQFYKHRANMQEYAKGQDIWLESILTKCKKYKFTIVFEHIPWFLESIDEDENYFNLEKNIRLEWLKKFKEAGVNKIMCGHYHKNAGAWYEGLELVVTSAVGAQLGEDKSGARVVRMLNSNIEHEYYALEDIPEQVNLD